MTQRPLEGNGYVADTSALIDLKDKYPGDVFPAVWKRVSALINDNRLRAPREVYRELQVKDDELTRWARNNLQLFISEDTTQLFKVKELLKKHPTASNASSESPDADPFVIVLAEIYRWCVISSEERKGKPQSKQIPDICDSRGIHHVSLLEFFRRENWKFEQS